MTLEHNESLGLSIDMLDVDRLLDWARNIETYGSDLTHWSSPTFVVATLRDIAARMDQSIRDTGTLRKSSGPVHQ